MHTTLRLLASVALPIADTVSDVLLTIEWHGGDNQWYFKISLSILIVSAFLPACFFLLLLDSSLPALRFSLRILLPPSFSLLALALSLPLFLSFTFFFFFFYELQRLGSISRTGEQGYNKDMKGG